MGAVALSEAGKDSSKNYRLLRLALLNAYVQVAVWGILTTFTFFSMGSRPPTAITITRDSPVFPVVSFAIGAPGYILPILSIALVPALRSRKWQIVSIITMLLNAGLLLLAALVFDVVFFIPMIGYFVSALLVGYSLLNYRTI